MLYITSLYFIYEVSFLIPLPCLPSCINSKSCRFCLLCVIIIGCYYYYYCVVLLIIQLCLTLCDSMDCSPPGSSVHGILQTKYWMVASPFSRRSSWPRDRTCVSFLAGGFFTIWAMREEAQVLLMSNSRIFLPIYLCFPTHFPSNSSSSVLLSFFKSTVWSCHFMSLSSHKKCSVTSHGLYPRLQPHRMALCPSGIHRTFSTQSLVSPSPLPEVPSTWGPLISLEPIPHHFAQS